MDLSLQDPITELASRQHGVVTRRQLLAVGLTRRMVDVRLRARALQPLHRGVYLLGSLRGALEPPYARMMAAVLACGPGAVVSHRSAARIWGLLPFRGAPSPVDVTVASHARPRRPGIRAHRSADLPPADLTHFDGIPITTVARVVRDLSFLMSARALRRIVTRAERDGVIRPAELPHVVGRHHGRPGAPLLRAALHPGRGPGMTRSEAEERFLDLVRRGRLPAPRTNVVVRGHEVDFLWRAEGLAVEVDGFEFHSSRRSFENDRRRDAELAAAGIHVVRVTWRQIADESSATLVRLAQALAVAAARDR